MRQTFAALLIILAAAIDARGSQQPPSPPAPAQPQQGSTMPAMPEEKRVKAENIDSLMAAGDIVVLDVREPKEIEELGGYDGAINIPLPQLEKRLGEVPKDKTILTA
jgi:hypothetical protein